MKKTLRAFVMIILVLGICSASYSVARSKASIAKKKANTPSYKCLPSGTKSDDVVSVRDDKTVSVAETLNEAGATCKGKKLVGKSGKPIYFYKLIGCWGRPPEGYQEIMAEQERKIEKLEKKYEVIRMTCNPSGAEIY